MCTLKVNLCVCVTSKYVCVCVCESVCLCVCERVCVDESGPWDPSQLLTLALS